MDNEISINTLLNGLFTMAIFSYSIVVGFRLNSLESLIMTSLAANDVDESEYDEYHESNDDDEAPEEYSDDIFECPPNTPSEPVEPEDAFVLQVSKVIYELSNLKECSQCLSKEEYEKYAPMLDEVDRLCSRDSETGFHSVLSKYKDI